MIDLSLNGCIKCGACQLACPVSTLEGLGKFSGPRRLAVESVRFSAELGNVRDDVMKCTTCFRCGEVCPAEIPLPERILEVRRRIFQKDLALSGHRKIMDCIDVFGRSVEPKEKRAPFPSGKGEALYFPGCIAELRLFDIPEATLALLGRGGSVSVPQGWVCCGAPLEKLGDWDRVKSLRERNLAAFDKFDTLITSCPGCATHFVQNYSLSPLHTIEYLFEGKRLPRTAFRANKVKVALHHPCHLSRTIGPHIMDYAAELLQRIPGVRLVEMSEPERCCGGGGGVVAGHPDVAIRLAREKVRSAKEAKADILVAPCPFCVTNLRRAGGIETQDLVVFLERSLVKKS